MPFVVREDKDPDLHQYITNRNLLWQYDFLLESIQLGLKVVSPDQVKLTQGFILSLNHFAVVNLTPNPGLLRSDHVHIRNSDHEPPVEWKAKQDFSDLVSNVGDEWAIADPLDLACRVLWRLNWIHPFEEGNGRTARAACYYVLCLRAGFILPGRDILPQLMRRDPEPYYQALRHADVTLEKSGHADLTPLKDYIERLLVKQLKS
jgi:Fic family protein